MATIAESLSKSILSVADFVGFDPNSDTEKERLSDTFITIDSRLNNVEVTTDLLDPDGLANDIASKINLLSNDIDNLSDICDFTISDLENKISTLNDNTEREYHNFDINMLCVFNMQSELEYLRNSIANISATLIAEATSRLDLLYDELSSQISSQIGTLGMYSLAEQISGMIMSHIRDTFKDEIIEEVKEQIIND